MSDVAGLVIQWRHNAQGCGRRDAHAAATWRSCARELEAALSAPAGNVSEAFDCPGCRGHGYIEDGDHEIAALFDCDECGGSGLFTVPVGATVADAANDRKLSLEDARKLLRDVAHAIKIGGYTLPAAAEPSADDAHGLPVVDEERFTLREIVQALTRHYKSMSGDDRDVPATIIAAETAHAMLKFIYEQRDAALGATK